MSKTTKYSVDKKIYDIPVDGSLGLLALGAVGLKAWRKKREEESSAKRKRKTD